MPLAPGSVSAGENPRPLMFVNLVHKGTKDVAGRRHAVNVENNLSNWLEAVYNENTILL
jgi:hypothetical protein